MLDKTKVNVVFIGREGMYAALHNDQTRSSSTAFIVASVTYRGLVREKEEISPTIEAKRISEADRVFILCSGEAELKKLVARIKELNIQLDANKFVIMMPESKIPTKKNDLAHIPFTGSLLKHFQEILLEPYSDDERERLRKELEAQPKRKSTEKAAPSPKQTNPNADLEQKQVDIHNMARDIETIAGNLKAKVEEASALNVRKDSVDQGMAELQPLKQKFDLAIKEYKERTAKHPKVEADLNKPVDESLEKAKIAYEVAEAAKKKLDEEIVAAAKREADEIEEAARVKAKRDAEIAAAIEARRQLLAKLQAIQSETGVEGIEFDPTKPNWENDLQEAFGKIKKNVPVIFLRAAPYPPLSQELSSFEDLVETPKDREKKLLTDLGIAAPVIVDNLDDFKTQADELRKLRKPEMEPVPVPVVRGAVVLHDASVPEPQQKEKRERVEDNDALPAKKPKRALNPHRFTIKHTRYERKELLAPNYQSNWLELNRLSVEKNCETSRFIVARAGGDDKPADSVKIDQAWFKVVIDLLKLLDKEERRWKPKFWTCVTKYADDPYLVKRDAQRKLIYHVAEKLFQELEKNPRENLTLNTINRILAEQSVIYSKDGHVREGILRIIKENFPIFGEQIRFPEKVDRMEAAAPVGLRAGSGK